jgi:hypothetical protein
MMVPTMPLMTIFRVGNRIVIGNMFGIYNGWVVKLTVPLRPGCKQ